MASKRVPMTTKPAAEKPASVDDWVTTPRTQTEAVTPTPPPQKEKMKRLTLDIPESLHKAIKTRSVADGVAMADMLRNDLAQKYGNQ